MMFFDCAQTSDRGKDMWISSAHCVTVDEILLSWTHADGIESVASELFLLKCMLLPDHFLSRVYASCTELLICCLQVIHRIRKVAAEIQRSGKLPSKSEFGNRFRDTCHIDRLHA